MSFIKEGDFAAGLQDFFTRGIKGPKGPKVRFSKRIARVLIDLIREHQYETAYLEEKQGEDYADDFCATMQWLANQVYSKYSPAEMTEIKIKRNGFN